MRDFIDVLEKSALSTMTNCLFQFVTVILTTISHLPWEHNYIANLSNVKLNNNITIKIIDIVCKTLGTIVFEMINYCCLIFVIASNTLHTLWIVAAVLKQLGCHLHVGMWKHCVACFLFVSFCFLSSGLNTYTHRVVVVSNLQTYCKTAQSSSSKVAM